MRSFMDNDFNTAENFLNFLHKIYGLFLDAGVSFPLYSDYIKKIQRRDDKNPIKILDERTLFYGKGNTNDKNSVLYHHATQGEVKNRNKENGNNVGLIGNFCLVLIYQFWEEEFREGIAKEAGLNNKEELKVDVMGEIKNYRNSIIHHKSKAKKEVINNKILNWFKQGEFIMIDKQKMNKIIIAIVNELKKLEDGSGNKLLTKNIFTNNRTHRS